MEYERILSFEEKQSLHRDGYVILKNVIPHKILSGAIDALKTHDHDFDKRLGYDQRMTDLINRSHLKSILDEVIGPFDPPTSCHVAVKEQTDPSSKINNIGYRDEDTPYFGSFLHMDGLCSINVPQNTQTGSYKQIYEKYIRSGPKGDLGHSAEVIGHNLVPLFQDPEKTLSLGSFTALICVCLSPQTEEGWGQTAVLPGAHHKTEEFFRWQRDQTGQIGPEGPDWPRLDYHAPNRCGIKYLPDAVQAYFLDSSSEKTPDGRQWPKPTPILMEPGDACISTFHLPHTGTRNEKGHESRKTVIFRIRNKTRQPNIVSDGYTDHPDRGLLGEWLDLGSDSNPWERSKDGICDMWADWSGMHKLVASINQ